MARKPWRLARWTLSFVLMTTGLLTAEMIAQEAATPPLVAAAGTWSGGSDPGAGSRPWQPVKSIQLDAWLSVGVNVYNGNLMLTTKALQMPGVDGFDLDIDPLYNDLNRSYVTDMGKGWSMDTGRDVGLDLSSPTKPVFHDPSGATYTFTQSVCGSSCTYTSPPGIDAVLGYDGTSYGLTYNASGDSYFFNTNGYLTATGNRAGKRIAFSYDSSGRLSQIVNTEGQGATFTYNAQNQIATIYYGGGSNGYNRTWTYGYNSANDLASITDPLSHVTQFSYDSSNNLTQIVDPMGNKTLITYSTSAFTPGAVATITRVTNPSANTGPVWQFSAVSSGGGTSGGFTDPNGHSTGYGFDGSGRETSMTDAEGHTTQLAWTGDNQVSQETPPGSGATTYSYDNLNNPTKTTLATGANTTATYNTTSSLPYLPTTQPTPRATPPPTSTTPPASPPRKKMATEISPSGNTTFTTTCRT